MRLTYLALRSAFKALRRNVFRSLLTCLGIVVGISAVIAIMEIGQGASLAMQRNIAQLGANLLFIAPGTAQPGGISSGSGTALTLTAEDCNAVREECTAVSDTAPGVASRLQLVYGHKNWQPLDVQGTSPSRLQLQNWSIAEGEPFTEHDVENASLVCVIGQTLARELFEGDSPVGKPIRIRNANVKVVGVLGAKGASLVGQDQDDVLMMPWTTLKYRLSNQMLVNVSAGASAAAANPLTQVNTLKNLYPGGSTTLYPGLSDTQFEPMRRHILYTSIGAGLAALGVTAFLGMSDLWRRRVYAPILLILLAAAGLMTFGAHFGGEGIYLQGVSVQMKYSAAKGFEWWVPARSTHILIAGLAMAVSLGALGASLRVLSAQRVVIHEEQAEEELAALTKEPQTTFQTPPPAPRRVTDDLSMARTLNADAAIPPARLPGGRFWILASLLFITALGLGVWYQISLRSTQFDLSHPTASAIFTEMSRVAALNETKIAQNRIGVHIVLGVLLAVLPLFLAVAVRFLSRARIVVGVLCLLMVLLIAAEIWIGVLLSVRGAEGPIYRFPSAESAASETA